MQNCQNHLSKSDFIGKTFSTTTLHLADQTVVAVTSGASFVRVRSRPVEGVEGARHGLALPQELDAAPVEASHLVSVGTPSPPVGVGHRGPAQPHPTRLCLHGTYPVVELVTVGNHGSLSHLDEVEVLLLGVDLYKLGAMVLTHRCCICKSGHLVPGEKVAGVSEERPPLGTLDLVPAVDVGRWLASSMRGAPRQASAVGQLM